MNDDPRPDDISELWGAQDFGVLEPAPPWRPAAPRKSAAAQTPNGNGQVDRVSALEHDVRALADMVERLESLVNDRLDRLERQVAETTKGGGGERGGTPYAVQKGVSRLSEAIRSTRNR